MAHIKNLAIQQANGDRASRSDGAGSPIIVIRAADRHMMTGALVMFPGQDRAALDALTAYARQTNDTMLAEWADSLEAQWTQTNGGVAWQK